MSAPASAAGLGKANFMVVARSRRASEASRRQISEDRNSILRVMVGLVPAIQRLPSLIA
ncbi:hypothetical protein BOSE62_110326 [Bosea sp. 62]|nr:hypothetical protein BOSE21B_50262 [Bosea sp. 21B]CAD5288430.1 hypothetical protein BOSE46_70253 [Bosea sp. 46]CAD5301422.1 hypothetical protein BOSE7B_90426 [Bosea sp. 7B]VVT60638.1 hypothetical protein BOS5A_211429 [Bosea sp. EC-HK365B]VXB07574.1 hypothetical protein BOSE62_110326 [Bosea sp. 62]VXB68979.1 hypothetical protein BOSE127_140368 [Bosea sp. 127]VXC58623.1 hypothetical protein BOSE29B_50254 [Bosea sp. 29B]VXC91485.1 hypothetical protein BOSE125_70318 [Bosea sp. 125]